MKRLQLFKELKNHHVRILREMEKGQWTKGYDVMTEESFRIVFSRIVQGLKRISPLVWTAMEEDSSDTVL